MIRFSCGCESKDLDDGVDITHKDYYRDGSKSIGYSFVCKNCVKNYEVLVNQEEEDNWMQ